MVLHLFKVTPIKKQVRRSLVKLMLSGQWIVTWTRLGNPDPVRQKPPAMEHYGRIVNGMFGVTDHLCNPEKEGNPEKAPEMNSPEVNSPEVNSPEVNSPEVN